MSEGAYLGSFFGRRLSERIEHPWPKVALDAAVELCMLMEPRVVEEGDCLLWTGATTADGDRPKVYSAGEAFPVRLMIWKAMHGDPKPGFRIGAKCGTPLCVEPSHLIERDRAKELKGIKRSIATKAKIAKARRAQSAYTPEFVEMVRSSPKNHLELSKELDMPYQTIQKWRKHALRQNYVTPFAGLGSRA